MGKRRREDRGNGQPCKRADGEGEYPPPHQLESEAFESYYKESGVVPEGEWDQFIAALKQPLGVSFRITGHKDDPGAQSLLKFMERAHISRLSSLELDGQTLPAPYPIAWYPGRLAWRFDVSRAILRGKGALKNDETPAARTLAAFHNFLMAETELGMIARQEEVSMVPPMFMDVQPGMAVCDLCASPGSKTQQLIEAINPPLPISDPSQVAEAAEVDEKHAPLLGPSGLVIANDMDYRRCHLLVHQAKRLNSPALIVTNHDATMLPTKMALPLSGEDESAGSRSLRFDRVLCDVPCSGDGTLRKAPDLWRRWGDGLGLGVHKMQLSILTRGLQMLLPGGRLVYSTCSMNPIEDEAVVAAALLELGADNYQLVDVSSELPGLKRNPGLFSWRVRADGAWYSAMQDVPKSKGKGGKGGGGGGGGSGGDGGGGNAGTDGDGDAAAGSSAVAPKGASNLHRLVPSMFPPPVATLEAMHIERCMRVLPHQQDTGGFFIAVLQRSAKADKADAEPAAATAATVMDPSKAPAAIAAIDPALLASGAGNVRAGDWLCPLCGFHCFAKKDTCFKCGGTRDSVPPQGAAAEPPAGGDPSAASAAGTGTSSSASGDGSGGSLQSRIPSQKGTPAAPHVLCALHCGPRNNGKYDALYHLTPSWHEELKAFFGVGSSFPSAQLVTRSVTGKAIFFIGTAVLKLLTADAASKFKLVNTGTKILEKAEPREGVPFPFRLCQEGAAWLAQHMGGSKQRVFLSTIDLLLLLQRRSMAISAFRSESLKQALAAAQPGALVLVHDPAGRNELDYGKPLPLVLAATRSASSSPGGPVHVELVVKAAEAISLYNRTAGQGSAPLPAPDPEAAPVASGAAKDEEGAGHGEEDAEMIAVQQA